MRRSSGKEGPAPPARNQISASAHHHGQLNGGPKSEALALGASASASVR
jgi:hypothetical protein